MKSKKFIIKITALLLCVLASTGCIKFYDMDNVEIVTTNYATEYAASRLYGEKSTISNIYPYGMTSDSYKLTEKQLKDYSKKDIVIYDGNTNDKENVRKMLKNNKNLKIIDSTYGIEKSKVSSDSWLNLSDFLMIAQNIKEELTSYINNKYLTSSLDDNYESLKIDITSLEAALKLAADNSVNKSIITIDESMKFLEKYGFEVINLTEDGKNNNSNIDKAEDLLDGEELSFIFVTDENNSNKTVEKLLDKYDIKTLTFKTLKTISEKDKNNNEDFLTIMQSNISLITQETYQ